MKRSPLTPGPRSAGFSAQTEEEPEEDGEGEDEGFGDDFDDFEDGEFGEFDDGFEEPEEEAAPAPVPQQPMAPSLSFVREHPPPLFAVDVTNGNTTAHTRLRRP